MRLNTLCGALLAAMLPIAAYAEVSGDVVKIGVLTECLLVKSAAR
jgi:branched-chain amino acid transport system substrate-binding protein